MASRFASEVLALIGRDLLLTRFVRTFPVAKPAAGAEWSANAPGGVIWELLGIQFALATSAVVATRLAGVRVFDADNNEMTRFGPGSSQAASGTNSYSFLSGYGDHLTISRAQSALPTPPYVIQPSWSITSVTSNIDVADQYSGIFVTVREWDETSIVQEAQELFTGLDEYIEAGYREGSDY